MRELTEEELKLAPEWATHYSIDVDDGVIYESLEFCWWDGLDKKFLNFTFNESKCMLINRKPFDITKHEWSDVIADIEAKSGHTLVLKFKGSWISLDKDDAIAIAKDRGLTAEDLK